MSDKVPCHGCEKRHVGCHAKCPDYGDWNAKHVARRAEINAIKQKEQDAAGYVIKQKEKHRKRRNKPV